MKRFALIFFALSFAVLAVFGISGTAWEARLTPEASGAWLESSRWWAGPVGVGLLISDLLLPIPTTVVIGALGATLGLAAGAFWGWLGLSLAGWTGYGLARWGGKRWGDRLITAEEQKRFGHMFDRGGGLLVVVSRMLPILPEVLSVMAGLYGMRPGRFGVAVTLGSLPPALMFAWIGATAADTPVRTLLLLVALTGGLWLVYVLFAGWCGSPGRATDTSASRRSADAEPR